MVFLWDSKQPLVNRKTMFLNTYMGGVNMSSLQNTLMCKQIKLIYKIIKSDKVIGKHWVHKFDTEYREPFFSL